MKLAQNKMDELERDGQSDRSKKMPKRRAQARVQGATQAINPVPGKTRMNSGPA